MCACLGAAYSKFHLHLRYSVLWNTDDHMGRGKVPHSIAPLALLAVTIWNEALCLTPDLFDCCFSVGLSPSLTEASAEIKQPVLIIEARLGASTALWSL